MNYIFTLDDPVSQLHKCCFYIKGSPNNYLCLQSEKIIQYTAEVIPSDERKHQIQGIICLMKTSFERLSRRLCLDYNFNGSSKVHVL